MLTTISSLPPEIKESFNKDLLSTPMRHGEGTSTFEMMLQEALKLWYKLDASPLKKARCEALKIEIMEVYEHAKEKEKELEGKTHHKTKEFGYFVAVPKGMAEDIYQRLKYKRKKGRFKYKYRDDNAFSKIRKKSLKKGIHERSTAKNPRVHGEY